MSSSSEYSSDIGEPAWCAVLRQSTPCFPMPGNAPRSSSFDRPSRQPIKPPPILCRSSERSCSRPGSGSGRGVCSSKHRPVRSAPYSPRTVTGAPARASTGQTRHRTRTRTSATYAASVLMKVDGIPVMAPISSIAELKSHKIRTGSDPWGVLDSLNWHRHASECREHRELFDDLPQGVAPGSFVLHYPAHGKAFTIKHMRSCCGCSRAIAAGQKWPVLLSLVVGTCRTKDDEYLDTGLHKAFDYTTAAIPHLKVFCSIKCAAEACKFGSLEVDCMTPYPATWPHSISNERGQQVVHQQPHGLSLASGGSGGHSLPATGSSPQQQGFSPPTRTGNNSSSHVAHHNQQEQLAVTGAKSNREMFLKIKPRTSSSSSQPGHSAPATQTRLVTKVAPASPDHARRQSGQQHAQEECFVGDQPCNLSMRSMSLKDLSPDRAAPMEVVGASQAAVTSAAGQAVNPRPLALTKSTLARFQEMGKAAGLTVGASTTLLMTDQTKKAKGLAYKFVKEVWAWAQEDGQGREQRLLLEPEVHAILTTLAHRMRL